MPNLDHCYILFGEEKSNVSNPVFKVGHFIAQVVHLTILFDVFVF